MRINNDLIHIHSNRLNRDINVLFLLIPSLVFVFILLIFLYNYQPGTHEAQKTENTYVLGDEVELDKR